MAKHSTNSKLMNLLYFSLTGIIIPLISFWLTADSIKVYGIADDVNNEALKTGKSIYNLTRNIENLSNQTGKVDVFALLKLEKQAGEYEGSLQELHSGEKSPFDLIGTVKSEEKFKPESGSIIPKFGKTPDDSDK